MNALVLALYLGLTTIPTGVQGFGHEVSPVFGAEVQKDRIVLAYEQTIEAGQVAGMIEVGPIRFGTGGVYDHGDLDWVFPVGVRYATDALFVEGRWTGQVSHEDPGDTGLYHWWSVRAGMTR